MQIVGGQRIIDRVAAALRGATDRILVVSNEPAGSSWIPDADVVADILPGRASLIGIHAALVHARADVIVVAWDMPFVPAGLLIELRRRLAAGSSAVMPMGPNGPEGACAAYAAGTEERIAQLIGAGALRLADLADAIPHVDVMAEADVAAFGDPKVIFMNVNRPDDLSRAEAIAHAL